MEEYKTNNYKCKPSPIMDYEILPNVYIKINKNYKKRLDEYIGMWHLRNNTIYIVTKTNNIIDIGNIILGTLGHVVYRDNNPLNNTIVNLLDMSMKLCPKCKQEKSRYTCFNKDSNRIDGLYTYCKQCRKEHYKNKKVLRK